MNFSMIFFSIFLQLSMSKHSSNVRYNIPYLLDMPGTGHNICGEVYEVDEKMLGKLDELEDHPTYYERRLEKVTMMEDKQGGIYLFIT